MTRVQLTDEEWVFIEPYLPIGGFGPYPARLRAQFEGVLWRFRTGGQWREMPAEFGAWPTVHNRFRQWRDAGVFEALLEGMVAEAAKRGEVDLSLVSVDSTTARAHHDAAGMHLGHDGSVLVGAGQLLVRFESQHERHPGVAQLGDQAGAFGRAVETVGDHRPKRDTSSTGVGDQAGGELPLSPKRRVRPPLGQAGRREGEPGVQRMINPLVGQTVDTATTPSSMPPWEPMYWRDTPAVACPLLRSPESSRIITPPGCGALSGPAANSATRLLLIFSWSQGDSERNRCSRWTSRCWGPTTGSAPARQVSVLLRSRGSSRPTR